MDADDLGNGFRLGEWRVEPRELRISGPRGVRTLQEAQLRLLLALACHHGEAVTTHDLARATGLTEETGQGSVAAQLQELCSILGDVANHPRYIVPVGDDAHALIAPFGRDEATPPSPMYANADASAGPRFAPSLGYGMVQRLQWLIAELRRRHVFKVCGAYLIGMWLTLQVAEVTLEPLRLPGWWMTALTITAVIGLPIVAVLAWWYEITPGGIALDVSGNGSARMRVPRARRSVAPVAVAGVALMAGITGFAWWRSIESTALPANGEFAPAAMELGVPSIAVLPLVDMSPGGGHAYLGDGLSEELATRLAQVPGLRVAARTSAFEFKNRTGDVRRIGQSLGVQHVLEGSVRREGDSLRVTVQLIDAMTGFHLWAENYDRPWSDVIAVQDDIARAVTRALQVVLTPTAASTSIEGAHLDLAAFDAYLAGLALLRQSGDVSRLNEARRRFEQALALEPDFAQAHAALCEVGVRRYDRVRDPGDLERAENSCRTALQLDRSLLETEKALAALYQSAGRHAEARTAYEQLLSRHPMDADGAIGLGRALEGEGDTLAAERSFRRAIAIEPGFWSAHNALGGFLFDQGRVEESIAAYRRVVELVPSSASAHNNLGAALQMHGAYGEASRAFERSLNLEPSRSAYSNLGSAYFYLGRFEQAADNYGKATAIAGQDHVVWGNLADALWQLPDRREEAVATYRRALALAERNLAQTPRDAELLAQLAYYSAQTGATASSEARARTAVEIGPAQPYVRYYTSLAAIGRGDPAQAVAELEAAVAAGYPRGSLAAAPELAPLRGERGFLALAGGRGGRASDGPGR